MLGDSAAAAPQSEVQIRTIIARRAIVMSLFVKRTTTARGSRLGVTAFQADMFRLSDGQSSDFVGFGRFGHQVKASAIVSASTTAPAIAASRNWWVIKNTGAV